MPSVKDNKCPKGHSYTEENTYVTPQGYRQCRTCHRARMKVRRPATGIGPGGLNSAKTKCPKGHPYDEQNTITYKKKNGGFSRSCRICAKANSLKQNVKVYSITVDQFNSLLEVQNYKCRICERKFWEECSAPNVDHDHSCCPKQRSSCGKCIRGFLCATCNIGLGAFQDSPNLLIAATQYLKSGTIDFS